MDGIPNDVTLCKVGSSTKGSHFQAGWEIGETLAGQLRITIRSAFNIHYPTDSSLLSDGVRVLTRTMKRIVEIGGKAGERVRDRMRSVGHRVMEIARITRAKGQKQTKEKLQASYKRLLNATGQVVAQAKRIAEEVKKGVKKSRKLVDRLRLEAWQKELRRMIPLVQRVMRQTKARLFHNDVH